MAIRYPIEYTLKPRNVTSGNRWLTMSIKNIGTETLSSLDVRLNSLDAYGLSVYGTGSYIPALAPGEEKILPYQVTAVMTTSIYASVDGWKGSDAFHWESPAMLVTVGTESAELVSLFAMTEPYPAVGETIRCEALLRGLNEGNSLALEFWVSKPDGEFEELAVVQPKELEKGETVRYAAEVSVDEKGAYTVYAYLYEGAKRIGRETDHIYVT